MSNTEAPEENVRRVEVYMEDRTWEPATVHAVSADGRDALIKHKGVTTWLYRERGPGYPNEWRWRS
jgi:hypothetical protein